MVAVTKPHWTAPCSQSSPMSGTLRKQTTSIGVTRDIRGQESVRIEPLVSRTERINCTFLKLSKGGNQSKLQSGRARFLPSRFQGQSQVVDAARQELRPPFKVLPSIRCELDSLIGSRIIIKIRNQNTASSAQIICWKSFPAFLIENMVLSS